MKKEPGFLYRVFLLIGDALSIVFSFAFAYYFRTNIDSRPYFFENEIRDFILTSIVLLPVWIILLYSLGLYSRRVIGRHILELWRLFLASLLGVMLIITFDFFTKSSITGGSLFPVRTIPVYIVCFCFLTLSFVRSIISLIRRLSLRHSVGLIKVLIIGNSHNTTELLMGIRPETGFDVVAVVARNEFIPKDSRQLKFGHATKAIAKKHPDAIIYTANDDLEKVNKLAVDNHMLFYYSPPADSIIAMSRDVDFLAGVPVLRVRPTPLIGAARVYKRIIDIVLGGIITIVALPIMGIIWLLQKILDPHAPAIYRDIRLTRFNRRFGLLKFRSIKQEYCGMTAEEAFAKMGKSPEYAARYRANGDFLSDDPRYTKFGNFLRRTSLDELPQLFNVLRGDISLIGPRALQPIELKNYGDRGLILSVKSGLTGLAQVSGRRNISFNERRALDVYYVQNWTIALDIQIFFRTIISILRQEGAR